MNLLHFNILNKKFIIYQIGLKSFNPSDTGTDPYCLINTCYNNPPLNCLPLPN
jgi:hypothetical protein